MSTTGYGEASRRLPPVALALAGLVALATVLPLGQLVVRAFEGGLEPFWDVVWRPRTAELAWQTALMALTVGLGCLTLGVATAWLVVRCRLPARRLWWVVVCLPLAVPSYVGTFALLATFPHLTGFWPLVAVLVLTSTPLVTVPTMGALALADHTLSDVARTLGRPAWRAFLSTTMPQILPAALAGTLLAVLYALSDFGAPAMMRYETLTTGVYGLFSSGFNRTAAAATSLVLAAMALVCIWGEGRLRRIGTTRERSARVRREPPIALSRGATAAIVTALATVALASIAFPLGAMVWRMLAGSRYASDSSRLVEASLTTLSLGVVAATLATAAALPISHLAARHRSRLVRVIESVNFVGTALPGVIIALALVAVTLALVPVAYQTVPVLIAAYVILYAAKAIGSTRSAIAQVSPRAEEASRTLGRGPMRTWWSITVRGALPGIAAGWLLVAIAVMKELPATLMLRPIGVETLSTELWSKTTLAAYGSAAPIGLLLVAVGVVPAWWMSRSIGRR